MTPSPAGEVLYGTVGRSVIIEGTGPAAGLDVNRKGPVLEIEELFGLPAHPVIRRAAVVLLPLAAIATFVCAALLEERLGQPSMMVTLDRYCRFLFQGSTAT